MSQEETLLDRIKQQSCFGIRNRIQTLVLEKWSTAEIKERMKQRNVTTEDELINTLVEEVYLIESTNLSLLSRLQLERLAKRIYRFQGGLLPPFDFTNLSNSELVWTIAMMIIRDKIPHRVSQQRRLVVELNTKQQHTNYINQRSDKTST